MKDSCPESQKQNTSKETDPENPVEKTDDDKLGTRKNMNMSSSRSTSAWPWTGIFAESQQMNSSD